MGSYRATSMSPYRATSMCPCRGASMGPCRGASMGPYRGASMFLSRCLDGFLSRALGRARHLRSRGSIAVVAASSATVVLARVHTARGCRGLRVLGSGFRV